MQSGLKQMTGATHQSACLAVLGGAWPIRWRPMFVALFWLGASAGAPAVDDAAPVLILPHAQIDFYVDPANRQAQLRTLTAVGAPGQESAPDCPSRTHVLIPVQVAGWLTLKLHAVPEREAALREWLDSPSPATVAMSNRLMLQKIWLAMAAGIDELRGNHGRPGVVEFTAQISPNDCQQVTSIVHSQAQALQKITFPVAFRDPAFLDPASSTSLLWRLVEIAAHETMHLLQDHPYSAERVREIFQTGRPLASGRHQGVSMEFEVHARLLDYCLRQATLPNDWNHDRAAQTWRDQRSDFWKLIGDDPFGQMYDELFRRQQKILGPEFVGGLDDARLTALFGHCAMYLRHGPLVPESAMPLAEDMERGIRALQAMREVTAPIRIRGRPYGILALP